MHDKTLAAIRCALVPVTLACIGGPAGGQISTDIIHSLRPPPWKVVAKVEGQPLWPATPEYQCSWVTVTLHQKSSAGNWEKIERPDGSDLVQKDLEFVVQGPGAASFRFFKNDPVGQRICATTAPGPDTANILITYPRATLPSQLRVRGASFRAQLPVYRDLNAQGTDRTPVELQLFPNITWKSKPAARADVTQKLNPP